MRFFAGILALCALLTACAQQTDDPVAARYRDTEIRRSTVLYEQQNLAAVRGEVVTERQALESVLKNCIMVDEAERLGLRVTQDEIDREVQGQRDNYEQYAEIREYVDAWCAEQGITTEDYFARVADELPRVMLRQRLRDTLGEQYCEEHGLTFTKVNPPQEMTDYVNAYLDGLLDTYAGEITYY